MPRPIERTLFAVLSGFLTILAFPNFNIYGFSWVALLPLAWLLIHRRTPHPFLLGWLAGIVAYSGILYWIVTTFLSAHLSVFLAVTCLLLLAAYLGLYWGLWTWFLSLMIRKQFHEGIIVIAGAAAWVSLEYIRTYLFSGFPWTLLGDSQYRNLPLIQIASVTGVYGVSFLIILVNLSLATSKKMLGLAVTTVLLVSGLGFYRLTASDVPSASEKRITVALLQGNIDQYKKWDQAYVEDIEQTYERLTVEAAKSHPFLIVWPETSVPGYLLQDPPLQQWLTRVMHLSGSLNLVGAPVMHQDLAYNSAFMLTSNGSLQGEYDKKHLVPFGEIVPWSSVLSRFIHVLNELGGFAAGKQSPVLYAGRIPIGVNICYEAIFPNLVRTSVAQGAQLIANLTNDGWYMRTAAPYQHLIPNVFRAVENNRWVLRADNTGVSALIDPRGRIRAASPIFQPRVVIGEVVSQTQCTVYTRVGDLFSWLCLVFCCIVGIRAILRQ